MRKTKEKGRPQWNKKGIRINRKLKDRPLNILISRYRQRFIHLKKDMIENERERACE